MKSCSCHGFPWFKNLLRIVKYLEFLSVSGHAFYIKTALTARSIRIIPPDISRYFDGNFLKKLPDQKPESDMIKDPKAIITAENINGVRVKLRLTPDARASMLVASPMPIKHFKPMQQISSSFC